MSTTATLCECGCGLQAPLAIRNNRRRGHVIGAPLRFASGHNARLRRRSFAACPHEDRGYTTPCWIWPGSRSRKGYGRIQVEREHTGAHRAAYEALIGPVGAGLQIDHLCRVRECVNPSHMEAVSNAVNSRRRTGVRLTAAVVEGIRASDEGCAALARKLGVSRQLIGDVRRGRRWATP